MSENHFYELVKKWTISDYKTPGVKAEVILDMLISEFVEDIIKYHFCKSNGNRGKVKLLVKEFPIRKNENSNQNTKVDYLISIGTEQLLLVELKTTNDSFSKGQLERMKKATGEGVEKLIDYYYNLIRLAKDNKLGNRLDSMKYLHSSEMYYKNLLDTPLNKETVKDVKKLDYIYILLTDIDNLSKKKISSEEDIPSDKKIVLKDYCKNEDFHTFIKDDKRREQWKFVSRILRECAEFANRNER